MGSTVITMGSRSGPVTSKVPSSFGVDTHGVPSPPASPWQILYVSVTSSSSRLPLRFASIPYSISTPPLGHSPPRQCQPYAASFRTTDGTGGARKYGETKESGDSKI
jgi:hypothetical protein